jgi:putative GTP pyrophosphokinase
MVLDKKILATRFEQTEFEALKGELVKYEAGLQLVLTHLSNQIEYYKTFTTANPIEHVKSRIKAPESIAGKLKKKNLPITAQSARENLKDIAGVRIICGYAKDIFEIAKVLRNHEPFKVLSEKDYLTEPKESGYRSYHMIIEVTPGGLFGEEAVPVEIQLRTSAQDFWATLEHKVRYKYGGEMPSHLSQELQKCAAQIHQLDERMYLIHELVDLINADDAVENASVSADKKPNQLTEDTKKATRADETDVLTDKVAKAVEKVLKEDNQ